MKVLVTGANGFVGRHFCAEAVVRGIAVAGVTRRKCELPLGVEQRTIGEINENTCWMNVLAGCGAVVHLAARVHVMVDTASNPLMEFRLVNVQGTLNLARQAAAAGVRRFIFISSVKVNGELTRFGAPFNVDDKPAPQDAYGVSKMEAENALRELAAHSSMEVVIIRPPLVYGPKVKANFATMMRWLKWGIPLPLGAIHNLRSLVSLENLADLILICLTHPAAANQTFMVSDGQDVSTTELLHRMGQAMSHPAHLMPVSEGLLKAAAGLLGRGDIVQRLCGSLQVDISKTCELLGWTPPITLDEGLAQVALEFKK